MPKWSNYGGWAVAISACWSFQKLQSDKIHDPHEHRVIYVAKFEDAVYVLHAFEKKTQKTAEKDLNIARTAYAELKRNETKNS